MLEIINQWLYIVPNNSFKQTQLRWAASFKRYTKAKRIIQLGDKVYLLTDNIFEEYGF